MVQIIQDLMPRNFPNIDELKELQSNADLSSLEMDVFLQVKESIGERANIMNFRGFDIEHDLNDVENAGDLKIFADNIRSSFSSRRGEYIERLVKMDDLKAETRSQLWHMVKKYLFFSNNLTI